MAATPARCTHDIKDLIKTAALVAVFWVLSNVEFEQISTYTYRKKQTFSFLAHSHPKMVPNGCCLPFTIVSVLNGYLILGLFGGCTFHKRLWYTDVRMYTNVVRTVRMYFGTKFCNSST